MAAGQLLALLCLGLTLLVADGTSQRRCSVPAWDPRLGPDPVASNGGKVVLVALFAGYCSYCVEQAGRLNELREHLISQGLTDISMVIINNGLELSRQNIANLQNAGSIPVIQDTEDEVMFNQIFRGSKDDFVIYDRCGQRVAFVPHPYSYLGHTITERVIRAVYSGRYRACYCALDSRSRDPHDVMYGDQPMGPGYDVVQAGDLDLNCMEGDNWCRRYERNFRHYHWDVRTNRRGSATHDARLSNRPRLRPLQDHREVEEYHGHHGSRGHRGHGGHMGHHHNTGRLGVSFGGTM